MAYFEIAGTCAARAEHRAPYTQQSPFKVKKA